MTEFNKEANNDAKVSTREVGEFNVLNDNYTGTEFENVDSPRKRRAGKKSGTVTLMSSAAVLAIVGAAVVPGIGASASAAIEEVWVTDTEIAYYVNVEKAVDSLKIVAYNDFTRRESVLEEGGNEGVFTDLKPGMSYTVALVIDGSFGEQKLSQQVVYTKAEQPPLVTEWRGITHECTCNVDGFFHFTMDFVDENYYWTVFTATLEDAYGNVASCEFTSDLHGEQLIDVVGADLLGNSAQFTVTCYENGEQKVLYSNQVTI